jgi:hypothetical protein
MTLSKEVHVKLMSHLLVKESEMRTKHQIPKVSKSEKKSPVKNLAKRISELKTMEKKKIGEYKTAKKIW